MAFFFFDPDQFTLTVSTALFACRYNLFSWWFATPSGSWAFRRFLFLSFSFSIAIFLFLMEETMRIVRAEIAIFRTARKGIKVFFVRMSESFYPNRRSSGTSILRHAVPGISGISYAQNVFILSRRSCFWPFRCGLPLYLPVLSGNGNSWPVCSRVFFMSHHIVEFKNVYFRYPEEPKLCGYFFPDYPRRIGGHHRATGRVSQPSYCT